MRKLTAIFLTLILALSMASFAACGSDYDGEADLMLGWWGNPVRNERTTAVVDLFHADFPNIYIEEWTVGWGDYWGALATMAIGGDMPDIIQQDWAYLEEYVANGHLLDLRPFIESNVLDLRNVPESVLELGRIGEGIYAVSIGMNAICMLYDKNLLDSLGITVSHNMSIQDFIDISRDVYEGSGIRTNMAFGDASNFMEILLRQKGIIMLSPEGMGGEPADYQQFFDILVQGIEEGWHIRYEDMVGREGNEQNPVVWGGDPMQPHLRAWNTFVFSNMLTGLQNAAEEGVTLGMTTMPSDNPAASNYFRASMYFAITSQTQNAEAAAAFISFWTNSFAANQILLTERGVPISTVVADAIYEYFTESDRTASEFLEFVTSPGNSTPVNPARPPRSGDIVAHLNYLAESVALGNYTAEEAAQNFYDFGNGVLR
ncbi:MAG: ABC transporter substrate-binding protein [Defluviitaleaceae bacterium]|nr:ABC transporter substrate-binding protein [Defluviitaleaceae bacterium]MCL2836706.1 ABC transporter substrate-binding protein [Defluviitaleaceae bacterium]